MKPHVFLKRIRLAILGVILFEIIFSTSCFANEMIITYRAPESAADQRYEYDTSLLKLALEKTKKEYGEYILQPSEVMNYARAIKIANKNLNENFFLKLSYQDNYSEEMDMAYVPFPVDLGIVGYRVCFTSTQIKQELLEIDDIEDLRKYSHGQGRGWSDVEILRHNNFKVIEISKYESLFKMVATQRFDLFCRGTNELFDEYNSHRDIENFTYDTSMSISYPLPRFFYTHKSSQKALERITKGLIIAFNDGSLKELWRKNYQKSIDFVRLDKRKIYTLDNPYLDNLGFDYKRYFYDPTKGGR